MAELIFALIDKKELARVLKRSPRGIETWMKDGLPFVKYPNGRVRFSIPDVQAYLNQHCAINGNVTLGGHDGN